MLQRVTVVLSSVFLAIILVGPVQAQIPGISVGLAGGPSFPTGDLGDYTDAGFHLQGVAELSLPLLPFAVRANADFHQMSGSVDGTSRQLFANVNAVFRVPIVPLLLNGYLTGGPGIYHSRFSDGILGFGGSHETNVGFNVGAGVQVGFVLIDLFLEARYHNVLGGDGSPTFVPVTVGIMF